MLATAESEADAAEAAIEGSRNAADSHQAAVDAAEADLSFWEGQFRRDDALHQKDAISAEERDETKRQLDVSRASRDAAVARLDGARAATREAEARKAAAEGKIETARAAQTGAAEDIRRHEASVAQAQAEIEAARAQTDEAIAGVEAATAAVAQEEAGLSAEQAAVAGAESRVEQSRAQLQAAQAKEREAQAVVDGDRSLVLQAEAGTRQASAAASGAQEAYVAQQSVADYTEIHARTSGTVTKRLVDPGTLVGPGRMILHVAPLHAVRVQVNAAERHLAELEAGDAAYVHISDDPKDVVVTEVATVFPAEDEPTRTGTVEVVLDNEGGKLKLGAFVRVDLVLKRSKGALLVPSRAALEREGARVVYTMEGGVARERAVQVGIDNGAMAEILSGLSEGQQAIVRNASRVSDGVAVSTARATRASSHAEHGGGANGEETDAEAHEGH
jgi:RND family efflux transporter MFP subunit